MGVVNNHIRSESYDDGDHRIVTTVPQIDLILKPTTLSRLEVVGFMISLCIAETSVFLLIWVSQVVMWQTMNRYVFSYCVQKPFRSLDKMVMIWYNYGMYNCQMCIFVVCC